ncbi:MAG TPA: hypothetical protein VK631_25835, partial [Solirubrobacteraceae bacterium]|nr:hypothetical protein [Solirubrobacteraceae bacterium]
VDGAGNVNVSMVGRSIAGVGGFMDIAQGARTVVFCTTLTYGGLRIALADGRVRIEQEGAAAKFVDRLQLVSFAGPDALARGQRVLFVTERCVFRLTEHGLELIEVAPGIDVDRDVAAVVEFPFAVAADLGVMAVEHENGVPA